MTPLPICGDRFMLLYLEKVKSLILIAWSKPNFFPSRHAPFLDLAAKRIPAPLPPTPVRHSNDATNQLVTTFWYCRRSWLHATLCPLTSVLTHATHSPHPRSLRASSRDRPEAERGAVPAGGACNPEPQATSDRHTGQRCPVKQGTRLEKCRGRAPGGARPAFGARDAS
jgi:hypothetical protein